MAEILNREEAESVVTYRCAIRTKLNELEAVAKISNSGKFEFKNGAFPNFAHLLSGISSLVPVFGQPASAALSLAAFGFKSLEESSAKAAAEKILAVSLGDSAKWNDLTRQLSRELGNHRTEELRNLDKESAETLAKTDLAQIVAKILTGNLPNIEREQDLCKTLKTAAIYPNTITRTTGYEPVSNLHQSQQSN
jgi:hypothetical protein